MSENSGHWWQNPAIVVALIAALGGIGTAAITHFVSVDDKRCRITREEMLDLFKVSNTTTMNDLNTLTLQNGYFKVLTDLLTEIPQSQNAKAMKYAPFGPKTVTWDADELRLAISVDEKYLNRLLELRLPEPTDRSALQKKMQELVVLCP